MQIIPAGHIDDTRRSCLAFLDDPKLLDRRPSSLPLRTRQNRNLAHVCSFDCKSISKLSQASCRPEGGPRRRVTLILPFCNTEAMNLHLAEIAEAVAPGAHTVLLVDQAGWHLSARLLIPAN